MSPQELILQRKVQGWLGSLTLAAASLFAVLIFADRMDLEFVRLPAIFYSTQKLHLLLCAFLLITAAVLLKSSSVRVHRRTTPLFRSCRLLTRQNCHLCDDALAVLLEFEDALPPIELVDIDDDPQLVRQFGESVPVVEINGRIRFRGGVERLLLKRIIDAEECRERLESEQSPGPESSGLVASPKKP